MSALHFTEAVGDLFEEAKKSVSKRNIFLFYFKQSKIFSFIYFTGYNSMLLS